ncbi:MAG: hypothetical protein IT377_00750 [Polyangiaceae bacterium]|nr:hypothetical protein [Polyangiaceae bacterium]
MRHGWIAITGLLAGCASPTVGLQGHQLDRPMLASMDEVPTVGAPASPRAGDEGGDDSAGALLERGFYHFNRNEHGKARASFAAAIGTNNLNDAGRSLAYWHIYLASRRSADEDGAAEALSSFIVVSQDVLEVRDEMRYAVSDSGSDFVQRFNLEARLARARAAMSAMWAKRAPDFGRTAERAVPVRDSAELGFFLELEPVCEGEAARQVDRQAVASPAGGALEQVTLFCKGHDEGVRYFIERLGD